MKLLGSQASPFVRKVRIVLAEKQQACQFVEADVMALDSPVYAGNPLGKIPCLLLDNGQALYDSSVICEYLDLQGEGEPLLPASGWERIEVRRWEALADGVLDAAILYRWELTQRANAYRDPAWIARQHAKVVSGLKATAQLLGHRRQCADSGFSLADVAMGCMLGWLDFRLPEFNWRRDHPVLRQMADALLARPSFVATAPR